MRTPAEQTLAVIADYIGRARVDLKQRPIDELHINSPDLSVNGKIIREVLIAAINTKNAAGRHR